MPSKPKTTATREEAKPRLVPKLRFPEFQRAEGWKTHALGDVCKLYQSETIASSAFVEDGEHLVYGANGAVGRYDRYNHEAEEVVVSCRGNCGEVHLTKPRSWITGNSMVVSPNAKGLSKPFLFRLLAASNFKPVVSGSAQPQITRQGFSPFEVPIPGPAEQQRIAECLSSVDEVLAAQSRKVDALKTHKKWLMQQLFPREGETQPRLRFPEFRKARAWEVRKISDILVKKSVPATLDDEAQYREIGIRSHGKGLFHKAPVTGKSIGSKRVFHVVPDALVINIVFAWEQALAVTTEHEDGFIASHRFPMFVSKPNECDVNFIQRLFLAPNGKQLLRVASPGGAGRNRTLNQKEFENIEVVIPLKAEQHCIASCLSSVDALIASETQKHAVLQGHKRGLMQQLFPAVKEGDA
jgi:type I restriction enzyme S subunit